MKAYMASMLRKELRAKQENYRAVIEAKILKSVIKHRGLFRQAAQ